ncbi:MAG TPA: methionine--tRNA ligase subunit beta [Chloroflexota bacterium]
MISIEDFARIELRVGTVLTAEPVPGATKILKLTIDIGDRQITTASGIAQHYTPEELVGRRVVVVANLQPATIRGIESQGMILAASHEGHKIVLVAPAEDIPNGAKVR